MSSQPASRGLQHADKTPILLAGTQWIACLNASFHQPVRHGDELLPDDCPPDQPFDRNSTEYQGLVEAVSNGAVLFVGAGSSCRVGYPSWGALLSQLAEAAKRAMPARTAEIEGMQGTNGLLQANLYREILGDSAYQAELRSAFGPRTPPHDVFHETLIRIPFRHVLTTNYDAVLESAHTSVRGSPPTCFDLDEWDRLAAFRTGHAGSSRQYVHVHGSIARSNRIVLCHDDYNSRYVNDSRAKHFLHQMLIGHRVVFVGFSLNDEDLRYILREVAGELELSEPRHYALLPRPTTPNEARILRADWRGQYHVEPVFFDNTAGNYSNLETLIHSLHEDVQKHPKQRVVPLESVPSLLEDLLHDHPDIHESAMQRLPDLLLRFGRPVELQQAESLDATEIDRAIDAVFNLVKEGAPDQAIVEYQRIRDRHGAALTDKHRYRIDANIGNALYSKGDGTGAADAYLRAVSHYRDSREAKGLEVLAHFLLDDIPRAHSLAESLCAKEPEFGRARSLWVRTQPDTADFHETEATVPDGLRNDAEVAMAMSDLARRVDNIDAQERYARAALAASPDWPDALSALGGAIVTCERRTATLDIDRGLVPKSPPRIAEAEELFTKAIALTPETDPGGTLAGLLFNRSVARRFAGDIQGAWNDLREAFRRQSTDPTIVLTMAMEAESPADIAAALAAIDVAEVDAQERDQFQFARVWLLLARREPGDMDRALNDILALTKRLNTVRPPAMRPDVVRTGLRLHSELKRSDELDDYLESVPEGALSERTLAVLRGRVRLLVDGPEASTAATQAAISLLGDSPTWFDCREAALLAQECGLHQEAMQLWESLLGEAATGSDTVQLVRCAYAAGHWKKVLTVCGRVRAAGVLTREHLDAEVDVLVRSREPDRAISLLRDWLREHPGDRRARLKLAQLEVQVDRPSDATFDEALLPRLDDLAHAMEGAALVYVLRRGPQPQRALDVAYELYRRFPEHIASHQTLMSCVFDPSASPLEIERPTVAGHNTAVSIRRDGEQPRWIFVEDGPNPAMTRGEYSSSHELVVALWGKQAGDEFEFKSHRYTVLGVENKALHRVHEVMETYEENFPAGRLLRRFRVPTDPPADAPVDEKLGEMMTVLRQQEEQRELLESLYTGDQLPATSFARLLGRPVFDVVRYLAAEPMLGVRSDSGAPERWQVAMKALRDGRAVVLDATALAGSLVLGTLDVLPNLGLRLLVPRVVLDEVRELSLNAVSPRSPRATVGLHQGQLFFHEMSPEEMAHEVETLERVLRFIREHCDVVGGESTLELSVDLRDKIEGLVGDAALDALALAKKNGALLWSDDLGLHALAAELDLGVDGVWTQAVLAHARDSGRLTNKDYVGALANLVRHGYAFTRMSARDIADVLAIANWRSDTALGSAVLRLITTVALLNPHNRMVASAAFLLIWSECPSPAQARTLIAAILDGIGRTRSGPLLAAFVYRGNGLRGSRDPSLPSLKRMLRSWRSRDGAFRP